MALEEPTKIASAVLGNNQIVGTLLTFITDPGKGHWRIWGSVRHSLADGCLLRIDATGLIARIPNAPNGLTNFGPIVVDIFLATSDIAIDLAVATGAADTASAVIYAQKLVAT